MKIIIQKIIKLWDKIRLDNKKLLLFAAVVLILVFFDIVFLLSLQTQALKGVNLKIAKIKTDISALEENLNRAESLKLKQAGLKDEAVQGYKRVISEEEVPKLLQDISDKASRNNVQILQIRPVKQPLPAAGASAAAESLMPLLITLDLSCGYHQFGRFINDLENADTFIAVEGMSITAQETNYLNQRANLVLRSYVKK